MVFNRKSDHSSFLGRGNHHRKIKGWEVAAAQATTAWNKEIRK